MPYDRVGIAPGSIGDMIIESQRQQSQRRAGPKPGMRPMGVRRPKDEDVVRTVVDYRPTPMMGRRRGGMGGPV